MSHLRDAKYQLVASAAVVHRAISLEELKPKLRKDDDGVHDHYWEVEPQVVRPEEVHQHTKAREVVILDKLIAVDVVRADKVLKTAPKVEKVVDAGKHETECTHGAHMLHVRWDLTDEQEAGIALIH